uniref:Cuticle protein 6 n=1 Tax=Glossina brevipalpis TaxID=37001 RepID=A0A1A9WY83_9MUSC
MKQFFILCALLASTCSATYHGAVSTQYASLDPYSHSYSYGYADPNSQKHETRSHDGVTRGSYSYLDGYGHLQSVSYVADPHHGFQAVGTNLPKAPSPAAAYVPAAPVAHYAAAHAYPQAHIVLDHKGVPVDTPEVQHAKAAHAAAYASAAAAAAAAGHGGYGGHHHLYKRSLWGHGHGYAAPVALTPSGVPVDTPDVQAAKAEHAAAHAKALGAALHAGAGHAGGYAGGHGGGYAGAHGYHVPVINHLGVPVDTPEVQHAKAAHFAAVAKAAAEAGPSSHDDGSYLGGHDGGAYAAGAYGAGAGHAGVGPSHYSTAAHHGGYGGYKGPLHYPVLHNGVPVEPAEVQHARAAHLSALAAESHKAAAHGAYYGGHYAKW